MHEGGSAREAHNRSQQQAFDRLAHAFARPVPEAILKRLESIVESMDVRPGEAVLDVGTGAGVLIPFILKRNPLRVVVCDLSSEMLREAEATFDGSISTLQADVVDLPQDAGPFDVVFCNAMFGNVHDRGETLAAIARLLATGGRLAISHPMGSSFVKRLRASNPSYHLTELPGEEPLRQLLASAGLALTRFQDGPDLYLAIGMKPKG